MGINPNPSGWFNDVGSFWVKSCGHKLKISIVSLKF
jgi:hypothetical protein